MSDLRKAAEKVLQENKPHGEFLEALDELRQALAQPEQYDQTALELCNVCGWKAIIPDEGCLVCARKNLKPVAWMTHTDGFMPLFHKTRESALNWQTQPTPLYTAPPKQPGQEPVAWNGDCVLGHCDSPSGCETSNCCRANYTAPPKQPKQEPVAHLWECIGRWTAMVAHDGKEANLAPPDWLIDAVKAATAPPSIEAAVLAEREACLKEIAIELDEWGWGNNASIALNNVAANIRARGKK